MKKALTILCAALFAACIFAGCSSASSSASAGKASAAASVAVTDGVIQDAGTYTVPVTLEGGSGKASIQSPATVKANDNGMTATIVWSSSNYDLMVIDGTDYRPVSASGNATFEIPVATLAAPLSLQAETTAMGTPHLIDYTIVFDASAVKAA